jgi:hypothetical protein
MIAFCADLIAPKPFSYTCCTASSAGLLLLLLLVWPNPHQQTLGCSTLVART